MHIDKKQIITVKWNGYNIFLSVILSLCTVIMTRTKFSGDVWGTIDQNRFTKMGISAIPLFLFCFAIFYTIIHLTEPIMKKIFKTLCVANEYKEEPLKIMKFWGALIIIAWLPYYLSYYPGGIYSDTFESISFYPNILTNRHPFLYNSLLFGAIKFGSFFNKDLSWSMGLFLGIQMILLELEIIYFLYWMLVHKLKREIRICAMLYMVFFPLIPLYSISIWKDTPFCMAFLLWFMFWIDLYTAIRKNQWNLKTMSGFVIGSFLVAFTRNNGIYIITFSTVILIIATCKYKFKRKNATYSVALLSIIAIAFIQGPVYKWAGISQVDVVENLGIPIQQIGRVVTCDGTITEEQKESVNHFIPYNNIKEHYSPCLVDNLKWYAELDSEYLSGHMKEFWALWIHLLIQNPKIYLEAYLLETLGFWNIDVTTGDAYVQNFIWNNPYELVQTDYFEKWFGFSFQHFVNPRNYLSSAWFFWIFFLGTVFIMKQYGWRKICLFAPQLGVWLTLMIATPIAVSLRYISALMFTIPFIIIVPVLLVYIEEVIPHKP